MSSEDLPEGTFKLHAPWKGMVKAYEKKGPSGISHVVLESRTAQSPAQPARIDTLLFRNRKGDVVGLLRYYPNGFGNVKFPGEYSVLVRENRRRRGIGLALLKEADRRWKLDFFRQDYTPEGRSLAKSYLDSQAA